MMDHVEIVYAGGNKNEIFNVYDYDEVITLSQKDGIKADDFMSLKQFFIYKIINFIDEDSDGGALSEEYTLEFIIGSLADKITAYEIAAKVIDFFACVRNIGNEDFISVKVL